jgi:Radical SAM superfamily
MFESSIVLSDAGAIDALDRASQQLEADGLAGIGAALAPFEGPGAGDLPGLRSLLARAVVLIFEAFRTDSRSASAYAALETVPPLLARTMFDLALDGIFLGKSERDVSTLNEFSLLTLVGLLSSAGVHEQAALLLAEARGLGTSPGLMRASWIVRCRWAGCSPSPAAHMAPADCRFDDLAAARARIDSTPLDMAAHGARLRFALLAGDLAAAAQAVGVALALPLGDAEKRELVPDLVFYVAQLAATDELRALSSDRLRWAFAVAPGITRAVADLLEQQSEDGAVVFLDATEAERAVALLRSFVAAAAVPAVTAYPMRNGKPRVDTVWLEITNHCNQKCTFCPDMFREEARTWLPLDQIKDLIDQLADTISVGSMQLNAYGEPLLHPNIAEILAYIRERKLPFPTFFTSHGMTLVEKKLKQLSGNYPAGIAISLHNDSQESYEATRSHKIGDYDTLVARVTALMRQMAEERAPTHLRLYQMVSNGEADLRVDPLTRSAFPETPERMLKHVRKWEAIAARIAEDHGNEAQVRAHTNSQDAIYRAFLEAAQADHNHLPILSWVDEAGAVQQAFMSTRPVSTYANLLLEYDPRWDVQHKLLSAYTCGFTATPSLAIFANGRLGMCCLDLNSTATFGTLSDFDSLHDALTSPQALQLFAQLSNGVASNRGCQICLGGAERHCASKNLPGPPRPVGHFREGV